MKNYIYILIILLSYSCENDYRKQTTVCSCTEQDKVSKFITDNMKASNNMSDEEMEDVIFQLERTAIKTICHQELFYYKGNGDIDWEKSTLDTCQTVYTNFIYRR